MKSEDQVRVLLRSVEGCGSNGQKTLVNRRLFTFYNSNHRCAKCWRHKPQMLLLRGVVHSQSTFHLVVQCAGW